MAYRFVMTLAEKLKNKPVGFLQLNCFLIAMNTSLAFLYCKHLLLIYRYTDTILVCQKIKSEDDISCDIYVSFADFVKNEPL